MSETTHILSRSLLTSLRRRVALGLLVIASTVVTSAGLARADGDPASDVLVSQNVFVPWDASATAGEQARLEAVLAAATRRGYPIRVALIGSSSDLGSVTALWRQPQNYAHFLWQELSLAVRARVLVVMPNGFGLYATGGQLRSEHAALAATGRAASGAGLATIAVIAVRNLAAASGHPLPAAALGSAASVARSPASDDTVSWIVFAVGAGLIVLAWVASLRARPLRPGQPEGLRVNVAAAPGLPTTSFLNRGGTGVVVHAGQYASQGSLDQDTHTFALGG